ncbi:DNA-binding transcriptional MocR family regulator [Kitasatospora sp. GAS204A]|nr:DNA-binding transcriptional MocR family regulator [Kitasatospora sp. GAS204B]
MSLRAAPPAMAARATSVGASPVRDLLALTARPEVISFAGGLPAPDRAALRMSFTNHPPAEIAEGLRRLAKVLPA